MPPSEQAHSKLLKEASRTFLGPLGLIQKGRSLTWLDDKGWWLCVVEFQPSGFSKGSYLNVGCMWLWQEQDDLSFDEGYRVERFAPFENPDQFRAIARKLATRAAVEVERYRSTFQTVLQVSDYYLQRNPTEFWPSFHAAVACGVAGRPLPARRFFAQMLDSRDERDWVKSAQTEAAQLNSIVDKTDVFRSAVWETVIRTRKNLKLPKEKIGSFS